MHVTLGSECAHLVLCNCCSHSELTLQPEAQVKTLPEDVGQLNSFTFLLCNILPANASVISRWILPNGDVISDRAGRFITAQGDTPTGFSSLLVIQELSYRDAGYYTCEVVPTDECSCSFPPSATTEVQLLGKRTLLYRFHCSNLIFACLKFLSSLLSVRGMQ